MSDELRIHVAEDGAPPERLETLAAYLRAELLELDVADVRTLPGDESPDGARGDPLTAGALLVMLKQPTEALRAVVGTVRHWLKRAVGEGRSVRLEIDGDILELSDASPGDQERLVALFLSRHGVAGEQP